MKVAVLKLECIGDNADAAQRAYTAVVDAVMPGMGRWFGGGGSRGPWVARITGICPKFRFRRAFLRANKDYSGANSVGSRGIVKVYFLEPGLHEVYEHLTWRRSDRYFCVVGDDGTITKVSEEEAIAWLNNHSASA